MNHRTLRIASRRTLGATSSPSIHSWPHYRIPWSTVFEFQPHVFFAVKNYITAWGAHTRTCTRWVDPCSPCYFARSFGRSDQPKIQCYHYPIQNISLNFHSIRTVRWWGEKWETYFWDSPRILKNALLKSCAGLNFLQKTQWKHISVYPRSGARGLQKSACFKVL